MLTRTQIAAWLRRRGWVLNLVFILIGGYFVGGAVSSVLARSIRLAPGAPGAAGAPGAPGAPGRASAVTTKIEYQAIAARNLLGAQRENLKPVAEETAGPASVDPATYDPNDLRKCTLSASLRATLVAERKPEWSIAVMFNNASHETKVYSINEGSNQISSDATLFEIRSREVVVRRSDHFELCPAEGEGEGAPVAQLMPHQMEIEAPTGEENVEDASGAVTKTGENEWSVSRDYLEKEVLNNLSKVATQARIVPSFKNGKPNGFKLFSIKPRSIFSQIGLQNGDVIHKINGYEMTSPDKALEVYQKLKDAGSISVEATRRGESKGFTYNVK